MILSTRRVNLKQWVDVDKRKPRKNQKVWVCDADYRGFADYIFLAKWTGKEFIVDGFGRLHGVMFWQPRKK